jgi:hypothetical protein
MPGGPPPSPRLLPLRDPLPDVQLAGLASPAVARQALSRGHGVGPTVLAGGEIVGAWHYDETTRRIAWRALGAALPPELAEAVDAEAHGTAQFIAAELVSAPLHTPPSTRVRPAMPGTMDLSIEL